MRELKTMLSQQKSLRESKTTLKSNIQSRHSLFQREDGLKYYPTVNKKLYF